MRRLRPYAVKSLKIMRFININLKLLRANRIRGSKTDLKSRSYINSNNTYNNLLTWESWKEPLVYFKMRHLNPMLYLILSFVTEWPKFSQERNEPKRTREVILRSPHHTTMAELLDYLIKWLCVQCGGGRQSAVMKYLHSSNFGRTN